MTMYTTLNTRFRRPLSFNESPNRFPAFIGCPIKVMSDMTKYGIKD